MNKFLSISSMIISLMISVSAQSEPVNVFLAHEYGPQMAANGEGWPTFDGDDDFGPSYPDDLQPQDEELFGVGTGNPTAKPTASPLPPTFNWDKAKSDCHLKGGNMQMYGDWKRTVIYEDHSWAGDRSILFVNGVQKTVLLCMDLKHRIRFDNIFFTYEERENNQSDEFYGEICSVNQYHNPREMSSKLDWIERECYYQPDNLSSWCDFYDAEKITNSINRLHNAHGSCGKRGIVLEWGCEACSSDM